MGRSSSMKKHVILFAAANPSSTSRLALDDECTAIERELRMTPGRDDFDFRSKWAVSVDELMRNLNELQPTILHFSGHASTGATGPSAAHRMRARLVCRDLMMSTHGSPPRRARR